MDVPVRHIKESFRDNQSEAAIMTNVEAPLCSNCRMRPVAETVLCGFTDWCKECDHSLHSTEAEQRQHEKSIQTQTEATPFCCNCQCRPVAARTKCGWDNYCTNCDAALYASQQYFGRAQRECFPRPPPDPLNNSTAVCPCGWFAVRNRPLSRAQREGKENWPLHHLVTVPLTETVHVVMCLICESTFKHHHNAVKHMRKHHAHYHDHHGH